MLGGFVVLRLRMLGFVERCDGGGGRRIGMLVGEIQRLLFDDWNWRW